MSEIIAETDHEEPEVEGIQPRLILRGVLLSLLIGLLVAVVVSCAAPAASGVFSNIVTAL